MSSTRYQLTRHEGHVLIEADGRRYLVDTGSPSSVGRGIVRLAGREFQLEATDLMGRSCSDLAAMVGTPFDGLIGADILQALDVEISAREAVLNLSSDLLEIPAGCEQESVNAVPLVTVKVAGERARMFLDTGAPVSYLAKRWTVAVPPRGEAEDFYPLVGRFKVSLHDVELQAWGRRLSMRVGQPPEWLEDALALYGADGILGTQLLEHAPLRLSQRQRRVWLAVG